MPAKKNRKSKNRQRGFPSNEAIIDFVTHTKEKADKKTIARHFGLRGDQRILLKQTLARLRDQGLITSHNRKIAATQSLPKICVLEITAIDADGELQATPVDWDAEKQGETPKVLVEQARKKTPPRNNNLPGVGDKVLARTTRIDETDYQYRATIMKILPAAPKAQLLGVISKTARGFRVIPTDKKSRYEYEVAATSKIQAKHGELVSFEIIRDRGRGLRKVNILAQHGSIREQSNISLIALTEHEIPVEFPAQVISQCEKLEPFAVSASTTHTDMRDVPLITIDPPDARDHDDAVWAQSDDDPENRGGVKIIVAIADVAHYVQPGSALDIEAAKRGNSTYLPDQVVPMLPEHLSNELCSLKYGVDRPALACFMTFDKSGRKIAHHFDRIVMRSAAKLSYRQAQDAIDGKPDAEARDVLETVLEPLWKAYGILLKGRNKRQPLELDLPERKLIFGANGHVEQVVLQERFDAHKLIEEFMIQANVAAAESIEKASLPFIYRVHDAPSPEKLISLAQFLKTLGLTAPKGQVMKPANFNAILKKVSGGEYEHVVNQVILRSQSQAEYTPQNLGHFGLNLRRYAHFTSPIRRYADLTIHRALIRIFKLGKGGTSDGELSRLDEIAENISKTERRSMMAERATKDRMIAKFMAANLEKTFTGRISGATRAGLFVELDQSGADGFIPASRLDGDYFVYNESTLSLTGEKTGETFSVGDPVRVKLVEAAPVSGGLRFDMISQGKKGKPLRRRKRSFSRRTGPRRR